jgi:hypothetical protein
MLYCNGDVACISSSHSILSSGLLQPRVLKDSSSSRETVREREREQYSICACSRNRKRTRSTDLCSIDFNRYGADERLGDPGWIDGSADSVLRAQRRIALMIAEE